MVGGAPLLRHGQDPRDRLASPTDHQLSFSGDQLGQLAETGSHLTNVELFHQRLSLCCNFSQCSTCGGQPEGAAMAPFARDSGKTHQLTA